MSRWKGKRQRPHEVDISDVVGKQPGPGETFEEEELAERDIGGGFRIREEPVIIDRDEQGNIARLRRFDPNVFAEMREARKEQAAEAEPVLVNRPMATSDRDKLVDIMAMRLFRYYDDLAESDPGMLNPIRDGIPRCKKHRKAPWCIYECREGVLPRHYGSRSEVFEWMRAYVAQHTHYNKRRSKVTIKR